MRRSFPVTLKYLGYPVVVVAWVLAGRLVWEQTVLSWSRGPQMIGFSLMHSGLGLLLVLGLLAGVVWVLGVVVAALITRSMGGGIVASLVVAYALAWCLLGIPYGIWQRIFVAKFSPAQSSEFFTYAAATGDLQTVKAFLARGVDINVQTRNGTALHGAAVEGELEVIQFLIAQGADVNAINAYGDSPLEGATHARRSTAEAKALLAHSGARLVQGSEEQRKRVISEQVRADIERMNNKSSSK